MEDTTVSGNPKKNKEESPLPLQEEDEETVQEECNLELSLSLLQRPKSGEQSSPSQALHSSSPQSLFLSPLPVIPHQDHRSLSFHPSVAPDVHLPQSAVAMQKHDLALRLSFAPDPLPSSASVAEAAAVEPVHSASTSNAVARSATRFGSSRRNPTQAPSAGKPDRVPPPFEWATDRRATVHSLAYLRSKGIRSISSELQCKRCNSQFKWEYDLETKFNEISDYIKARKSTMHDRAPAEWMSPKLPSCPKCGQYDSMKPVVSSKKKSINWLFLLLGKMLGCCTLLQLKYFCKHTNNHRTGAKDRVLYLTYLGLCKQLDPDGPFDPYVG